MTGLVRRDLEERRLGGVCVVRVVHADSLACTHAGAWSGLLTQTPATVVCNILQ
jgi:hypothetical protein